MLLGCLVDLQVNFHTKTEYDMIQNYMVLQDVSNKLRIGKVMPVNLLHFDRWICALCRVCQLPLVKRMCLSTYCLFGSLGSILEWLYHVLQAICCMVFHCTHYQNHVSCGVQGDEVQRKQRLSSSNINSSLRCCCLIAYLMHFNPSEFSMAFFCLSLVKTEKNV